MAKEKLGRKKAIYSRKSKFTGKGESIENQVTLCKEYLAREPGISLDDDIIVYEDEGFSGGNIFRPQFTRMMEDARAGKIDSIICYRLDRISRNIGDFAKLIDELSYRNISFVSIKEQFDTGTPMGKAMMYIASVFSQLERETIAERIRDNMHELSKTGRWLGGVTPTGYGSESITRVTVDGKERTACKLKTIPDEAQLVKLIFDKFLEVQSLTKTETYLMQRDYHTKNGKEFTRFALKNILSNPVYMIADEAAYQHLILCGVDLFSEKEEFDGVHGLMAYNRTIQTPGKATQIKPMEEWIMSVGKHEGVVAGAQWIKAQALLDENKGKSYRYRAGQKSEALLSGILRCGCGGFMRPKLTQRTNAKGELKYTYSCERKERSRGDKCNSRPLDGIYLDRWICDVVKSCAENEAEFMSRLEKNKAAFLAGQSTYEADLERVSGAMDENRKEIQGLVSTLAKVSGTDTEQYVIAQIEMLHQKGAELTAKVKELEALTRTHLMTARQFDAFADMLRSFSKTMDGMNVEQKRAAIRMVVRKMVWDGEKVHVYLFGTDDDDNGGMEFPPPPVDGDGEIAPDYRASTPTDGENSFNVIGTQMRF